jgi:hypothetical protein
MPSTFPSDAQRVAALRLNQDAAAGRVVRRLGDAGVESILLKGTSFARWLYPSPHDRPMADVDLLVAPEQVAAAEEVLMRMGYTYEPTDRPPGSGVLPSPFGAIPGDLVGHAREWGGKGLIPIDLHVTLSGALAPAPQVWTTLTGHIEEMRVGGANVAVLDVAGRALHVALHAFQHQLDHALESGQTMTDLSIALQRESIDTWRASWSIAQQIEAVEAFGGGLRLDRVGRDVADLLGIPDAGSVDSALRAASAGNAPRFIERLSRLPGARPKLTLVGRKLFPPVDYLHAIDPRSRAGPRALVWSYTRRAFRLTWAALRGVGAWRRARASTGDDRSTRATEPYPSERE